MLGAPWADAAALNAALPEPAAAAAAHRWRAAYFIPTWWKFNGSACAGVQYARPDASRLFADGVALLAALRALYPSRLVFDGAWFGQPGPQLFDRYAGTPRLRALVEANASAAAIADAFRAEAETFANVTRLPDLLYD